MKYKITIESKNTTEYPETDYDYVNKTTGEKCEYSDRDAIKNYFKTGKMLERTDTLDVYTQILSEEDIDIEAIIKAVNKI